MVNAKQAVLTLFLFAGTWLVSLVPVVGWIVGFVVLIAAYYCLAGRWA